ncbi:MAG: phosphoesterase PA-phosphatase related protein, partial [Thermomicrobiales bacterium]|nr:phosphoesterase PA-phosphatase related protein [Thermomicrobiales bacterium]
MSTPSHASPRVSRRLLVGSSLAGAALLPLAPGPRTAAPAAAAPARVARRQEPATSPAGWRTWLLSSPDELRPAAPGAPTQAEIEEVVAAQAAATDETAEVIARWGSGPAVIPWSRLAGEVFAEFDIGGMPLARVMAIYHTALHDAAIAAWDAQVAHARPSPGATSDEVTPADGVDPDRPSFPSEHAAVAGAAAVVLASLLPDAAAGRFDALATEAAESRIAAGAAFPSDVEAGLALGKAVGEKAVARAEADGSDAEWDLERGDQVRPAAPPEHGSPAWQAELKMIQEIVANRSFEQERAALWWGDTSPSTVLNGWAHELIGKEGLDLPHAAQVLADLHAACADAAIAVWDAKFTWWTSRPITEDPTLDVLFPAPPYPSYPSGYSGLIGAGTTVVGHYFPDVADEMANRAWEAAASRAWAG